MYEHDIQELTKEGMIYHTGGAYFGYTKNWERGSIIYLRSDLPQRVKSSVLVHELTHVKDRAFTDGKVWHWEFKAWKAQWEADKIGTLQTMWLSITDLERIKLYAQRLLKGF